MGPQPTHRYETHPCCRPRESGDPRPVDSRFRGNDVTFDGAQRGISPWFSVSGPPAQSKIPHFARNDISWFLGARQQTGMTDCFK
jgi:hypothetical protein